MGAILSARLVKISKNRRASAYKSNELAPESLPLKIFQKLFLVE
jgi:hypothetical protein